MEDVFIEARVAIMLRTARAALGITQQKLADSLEIQKSTLARIEKTDIEAGSSFVLSAFEFFKQSGIAIEIYEQDGSMVFKMNKAAVTKAALDFEDANLRRSDRLRRLENTPTNKPRNNKHISVTEMLKLGILDPNN